MTLAFDIFGAVCGGLTGLGFMMTMYLVFLMGQDHKIKIKKRRK